MAELKKMSGDEFVTKLLAGERDFRRIKLEYGDKIIGDQYRVLRDYLSKNENDRIENPINLIGSDLSGISLSGLNFSYVKAHDVVFSNSHLSRCRFAYAD